MSYTEKKTFMAGKNSYTVVCRNSITRGLKKKKFIPNQISHTPPPSKV